MALTSSINNAIFNQLNTVWGTGEIVGEVIPTQVRTASNNATPFKITGLALYLSGRNSAVSTAIGVETSTSPFFESPQGTTPVETGIKPISYTFATSPQKFNVIVYANGSTNVGTNNYDGLAVQVAGITIPNKTLVGRYEYIQVPAAPIITSIDLITSSSMRVSFSPPEDTGGGTLVGYQLQVASSSNFSSGLRVFNITETSHTVTNLDSTKTYYVRVLAKNELWAEAQSAGSPWSAVEAAATRQGRSAASSSTGEAFFRYTEPSASNLYSEKVFAEHPLSLWSLDDKSDYISLISESNRNLAIWEADGGAAQANNLLPAVNVFTNPSFESSDGAIELTRNILENPSFEANDGVTEIWRNVYPNPTFSEGAQLSTFTNLRTNYITNPNFETNASGWSGSPAITRQTTTVWNGTASGQVAWTALNQSVSSLSGPYIYEGQKVVFSAWVRMTAGRQIQLGVVYNDGTNPSWDGLETANFTGTGNWQRVSLTITGPFESPYAGYFSAVAFLKITNKTSGTNTMQIDGVLAEVGDKLNKYFDGNGYGPEPADADHTHSWTGTANASISNVKVRDLAYTFNTNPEFGVGYQSSLWGISLPGGVASRSVRITPTGSNNSFVSLTHIRLKPATTYTVLGTIRLNAVQSNPGEFARKFRGTINQQEIAFTYLEEAPNTIGEHTVRATFETSSNPTVNQFSLYNGDDTVDVWWDNVNIVEGVYLGDYFDSITSQDSDLLPALVVDSGTSRMNLVTHPSMEISSGTAVARTNLAINPSFETNTTGWAALSPATISRITTSSWWGGASLQISATGSLGGVQMASGSRPSVTPGATYTASAYIMGEVGKSAQITIDWFTSAGSPIISDKNTYTVADSWWERKSVTAVAPANAAFAAVSIRNATAGLHTLKVDAVLFEAGAKLGEYFDGTVSFDTDATPAWSGTAHASASTESYPAVAGYSNNNAVAVQSSAWVAFGSKSMRVVPTSSTSNESYEKITVATTIGQVYTAKVKIRLDSAQVGTLNQYARKLLAYNNDMSVLHATSTSPANQIGETELSVVFTATSTSSTIVLYNGAFIGNGAVWFDNLLVTQGEYSGPYFDGNSPDVDLESYAWTGTANASTSTLTSTSVNHSVLNGLAPAGQTFLLENAKALLSSSWSASGTKSLKIISTSRIAPARYYATLGSLGLEVGKTYTALIKTYLDAPQTGTLYNFPTIGSEFTFEQFDNVSGVQEGRIVFTIDGTNVTLDDELSLYNRATVGNGDVWWDQFLLIEGDYSGDYFDGSSISSNPDITISWEGTPNISASIQSVSKPLGITNGYQTTEWSMLGEYSLRIPEEQTETITIAEESTITITARNIGQTITTNLGVYTTTATEEEITLYEVTSLILGPGDWDNLCIVAGTFFFGYFDGSNPIQTYYSTSWSGADNASTSIAQPLVTNIISIGVTEPFAGSATSVVIASDGSSSVRVVSPVFATWLDINDYMSSLSIGMFVASDNSNLSSIDLGFTDGDNDYLQTFEFTVPGQWSFVSSQFAEMPANKEYQIVAVFNLIDPLTETKILVNGITAGQWGEEYQLTSLGATKVELPAEIGVSEFFGVEAKAYGLQGNDGYYLINDNLLLARNIGMPMVYGANNITSLFPNPDNGPSLVLPGNGFLNDLGRYRDYTIEFWCRINSGASEPRRIFGPLHSTDGIYVDGPFITLKIGEYVGSHYISEWYRPMLIDLVYGKNIIRLMVDGEVVVSIPIVASSLVLPAGTQDGINQDWLGFYAYDDVPQVELDSFSVYSYQVPQLVAKRRFVYGQGVEFPETMNVSFNGKSVLVDHTFADYTNSYRYPDIGKWVQGTSENVSIRNNVLSTPEYALPQVVFNKQSTASWYEDLSAIGDDLIDTITMKPNDSWADTDGYLLFESLNIVKQDIKAFYGVFQVDGSQINDEVLFKVEDDATKNYLLITISGNLFDGYDIKYTIRFGANAASEVLLVDHVTTTNETIYAGVDIDRFARKYGRNLSSFFGSPRRLKVYAAGTKEFDKTFSGKISRIGFSTRRNFAKIASLFSVNGILVPEVYDAGDSYFGNDPLAWDDTVDGGRPDTIFFESSLKNHVASYTLFAKKYYDNFKLDIATDSYWEDYIPLTYLGKEVLDDNGDMTYGLDFIQFNIDYPRPIAKLNGFYDTSESLVKTYISFQYITTGANQPAAAFDAIIPAPTNGVIDPNTMLDPGASWLNKKFEIVNNTIIYPPEGIDFKKLALVIHLEFETRGILSKSVKIKNLQVSSKALNANQPNKIGTRLGQPVYPYTKYGIYFDYKAKNPYALYRGSTPYLYLTKDSGVKLAGDIDTTFNRGLSVTVNADRASRYRLTAIQAATLFPNDEFPTIPTPVFELDASTGTISFLIVSSHPNKKRGTIYAIDKATGRAFSDALFFLNGRFVKNPTISLNEWNMLSVAFMNNIALDGKAGAIRINGPMLFNNFSFYEETALQQARQASLRQWFGVRYSGDDDLLWDYWTPYSWEDVLVLSPNDYDGVNPVELYSTYSGTNKIVVGDDTTLRIDSYKYKVYQDIVSTPYTITPL